MGKHKKHARPTLEDALAQPWCYYCEKVCSDVGALLSHQKDKHFQCPCRRRLNTAGGLKVHMAQVHKEELKEVPNALDHRKDPSIEVFTMYGIPDDIMAQHRQEIETAFYREEYERRLRTGNPGPGNAQQGAAKKPKIESSESLKARVAQRRAEAAARRAAEAMGSSMASNNSPLHMPASAASPSAAAAPAAMSPVNAMGAYPTGFSSQPTNGAAQFTFQAGPNGFNAPPGMNAFAGNGMALAQGLPSFSPVPNLPAPPFAPSLAPGGGKPVAVGMPTSMSPATSVASPATPAPHHPGESPGGEEHETPHSGETFNNLSLPKLLEHSLQTIKSTTNVGKNGNDGGSGNGTGDGGSSDSLDNNNLRARGSELFVAICDRVYGSVSVSTKLLAKAEGVLRGLLNAGVESALPAGFAQSGKIPALKESMHQAAAAATAAPASATAPTSTKPGSGKKKDFARSKLSNNALSWEEQHALSRGTEKQHATPKYVTGPVQDAATGVVDGGEMEI